MNGKLGDSCKSKSVKSEYNVNSIFKSLKNSKNFQFIKSKRLLDFVKKSKIKERNNLIIKKTLDNL